MSEKLKIKLSIANRVYPLQFEQSYSVRDKQDVLAMCALQFASQSEQKTIDKIV